MLFRSTTDRGGDYSSLDYLIKTNKVSYAPSASVTAAVRDQKRSAGRNILLVADPVFSANDPRVQTGAAASRAEVTRGLGLDSAVKDATGQATQSGGPLRLPRLDGTRLEAEQIGRYPLIQGCMKLVPLNSGSRVGVVPIVDDVLKGRIAAGIDLHRVDRDAGRLGVAAGDGLTRVDRTLCAGPAVLGVQTVDRKSVV